jgi:hypothetical protein
VWVILRRLIPDALELVATNAHDGCPDFILKLRITFHPPLAPALGLGAFLLALQHRDRLDFLKFACEAGFSRKDRPGSGAGYDQRFSISVETKLSVSDQLSS